ncbi:MAG: potassium transporter Kup, partial [Solirubrobacteraceae bacterium]|nr:potassium transporter Kup [Solirubrobacteraceae bacterium]
MSRAPEVVRKNPAQAALLLGALGVVFGDIGTSPLYALQAVFAMDDGAIKPVTSDVYGIISLVVWSVTLVVSIKFVTFIMRADNDGEGGIMALVALIRRAQLHHAKYSSWLIMLGLFGVALFYGDGMITPAISVLSAVEGVEVAAPDLEHVILPITLVVLAGLFMVQRHGTHAIGRVFGPVMVLWFGALAAAGIARLVHHPEMLKALSPHYAGAFFLDHPGIAFLSLGSVVLTVTGAEALYADMGHFGRPPISRAWFFVVFPALTLNYMGQGSLILAQPEAIENPFYMLMPHWARVPMIFLATAATLIASQAVISGAFSVTRQAVQLGFLPRVVIRHTSETEIGQVYVPVINWSLFAAVIVLVLGFGSSAKLATAYGIAVTGTLLIDSILFLVVVRFLWKKPRWMVAAGIVGFVTVDLLFLTANLPKIHHGGWFPLVVGAIVFVVLATWDRGRQEVSDARERTEGPLPDFLERMHNRVPPMPRLQGVGVYLSPSVGTTPIALRVAAERIRAIPELAVIVTVITTNSPHVPEAKRVTFDNLGSPDDGYSHMTLRFGFMDVPDVPSTLARARKQGFETDFNPHHATYFLSHITIGDDRSDGMPRWRKRLF